jgi:hypothetical protein
MTGKINKALEAQPEAKLELTAERQGDTIAIRASTSDVKKDAKDVRLRLVLVEEILHYPAGNGQRFHHHVVRAMPGGASGVEVKDGSAKQEVKVDVADLHKALADYLSDYEKNKGSFADDSRPLDLKHLKVVALVQSDSDKAVLQSAQVDVGGAK